MTEHFESDAHDYVLNQMDAVRRAAFERELEQDPAARAALKTYADSLAGFACDAAGAQPMSASDHRATLGAIIAATNTASPARMPDELPPVAMWRRFLWPAAAAILLALNLIDFERPLAPASDKERPRPVAVGSGSPPDASTDARAGTDRRDPGAGPVPEKSLASSAARESMHTPDERARELEQLRANVAELERERQRLRAEYDLVARRLAEAGRVNQDLHRLSTMELVDAASFTRGERKGLVAVGRGILTEPGIVVVSDPPPPPPGPGTTSTHASPKPPYAWSVFDEQERRGYLNLYNLPSLPGDQSLQIWVRPADGGLYQRVAEVPQQYHGGAGNVQYALPPASTAPAEILITIEPRNAVPAVPMGPTILRGP